MEKENRTRWLPHTVIVKKIYKENIRDWRIYFYFTYIGILRACISVHHMLAVSNGNQNRVWGLLGLKLQMFINCHMGARN